MSDPSGQSLTMSLLPTEIDDCASDPCQNFGSCNDTHLGYNCKCVSGYTGVHCETGRLEVHITKYNAPEISPWLCGACVNVPEKVFVCSVLCTV